MLPATLFGLGRVLLWAGGRSHPLLRATGTCHMLVHTTIAVAWLVGRLLDGSFPTP